MNIIDALDDENLFGSCFRDPETWKAWRVFLKALFGMYPKRIGELSIFKQCTGRSHATGKAFNEAWLVVGRRGGKSFMLAIIAVFIALFKDWRPYLSQGERGKVYIMACDRRQATVIFQYIAATLNNIDFFRPYVEAQGKEKIELSNGIDIVVGTASFRSVRGYTIVAALLDEVAFWRDERSANPDEEVLAALRPAMASLHGNAILLAASSPYARTGMLWKNYQQHFGNVDSDVLVWKADTQTMNPSIDAGFIKKQYADDPANAKAEYGAEFRDDIASFISAALIDSLTVKERENKPFQPDIYYRAFVDPSGGSGDAYTLAIGHRERDTEMVVIDAVGHHPAPFSPDAVTEEMARLMRAYRVSTVTGDRFGGEWPKEEFRKHGINYELAQKPKNEIYRSALPLFNSGRVELLDVPTLRNELVGLERRVGRTGRDIIDHPPGGHDDLANAVCGVICEVGDATPVELWGGSNQTSVTYDATDKEILEHAW